MPQGFLGTTIMKYCFYPNGVPEDSVCVNITYNALVLDTEEIASDSDSNSNLKIYPNPALTLLHFENAPSKEVKLFDSLGKVILSNPTVNTINVSGFPSGVYFLKVGEQVSRFIKE